jgi:predicted phage tail protein
VKTVEEIRHARLMQLIAEHRTIQALANALGKSHAQISQLRNQVVHSATGKPRVVGDRMAREIEEKLGKPRGWMDTLDAAPGDDRDAGSARSAEPATDSQTDSDRWQQTARRAAQMAGTLEMTPAQFLRLVDAMHEANREDSTDEPSVFVQRLMALVAKQEA